MKTHTELLNQLIDAVYALPFSTFKEAHDLQMLAAEIKGKMMNCGTCDGSQSIDSGGFTPWGEGINIACPECLSRSRKAEIAQKPTPDEDGWIENTGKKPNCEVKAVRFANGNTEFEKSAIIWLTWELYDGKFTITHYKPA